MRSSRAAMVFLLQLGAVVLSGGVARAVPPVEDAGNLPLRGAVTAEAPIGSDRRTDSTLVEPNRIAASPMVAPQPAAVAPPHSIAVAKSHAERVQPANRSAVAVSENDDFVDTNGELDVDETSTDVGLIGGAAPERNLNHGVPEGLLRGGSDDSMRPQGTGAWRLIVDDKAAYKVPNAGERRVVWQRAPQAMRLFGRRKPSREFPMTEVALSMMALLAVVFGRSMLTAMRRRKAERGLAY